MTVCGVERWPGDPESPTCDLPADDPHDDGMHATHSAHGGRFAEWPRSTCARRLRGGGRCALDPDHRGRCSSVAFCCDACGKTYRGSPYGHGPDEGGPDADPRGLGFCFPCVRWGGPLDT